jgi:hypothetical protein
MSATSAVCTNCGAPSHSTSNCRIPKRMIERWHREGTGPPFFKKFAEENPQLFAAGTLNQTSNFSIFIFKMKFVVKNHCYPKKKKEH